MHNIVDLCSTIFQGFILLLSRGIGTLHEDITSLVEGRDRINKPISTSAPALTVIIWQSTSKTMSSTTLLLEIVSMEVVCGKAKRERHTWGRRRSISRHPTGCLYITTCCWNKKGR